MKYTHFFLFCMILFGTAGCAAEPSGMSDEPESEPESEVVLEAELEDVTEPIEETIFEFSRETTVTESDFELEDDTGYGFAYHAANVLDADYSTAWCRAGVNETDDFSEPDLSFRFASAPDGMPVGIVPGFARDETIFYQNNRIKTLVVVYGAALEQQKTFTFEDDYRMQFFEMPEGDYVDFTFYVTEVYPGSKYDDTCIAEIDLWSDWVAARDADAAYNYYLENKAGQALRPVGIDHLFLNYTDSQMTSSCKDYLMTTFDMNEFGDSVSYFYPTEEGYSNTYPLAEGGDKSDTGFYFTYDRSEDRYDFPCCEPVWVSLNMNSWAEEGDVISVKWFQTTFFIDEEDQFSEVTKLLNTFDWTVQACLEDTFVLEKLEVPSGYSLGGFVLEFYYNDHLIDVAQYSMAQ